MKKRMLRRKASLLSDSSSSLSPSILGGAWLGALQAAAGTASAGGRRGVEKAGAAGTPTPPTPTLLCFSAKWSFLSHTFSAPALI